MKQVTGEGVKLARVEGHGSVYCADFSKKVYIIYLQDESLFVNGNDVLAFSGSLMYEIKLVKNAAMLAGGLFNVKVSFQPLHVLQQAQHISFFYFILFYRLIFLTRVFLPFPAPIFVLLQHHSLKAPACLQLHVKDLLSRCVLRQRIQCIRTLTRRWHGPVSQN